ncbi:hypothetical protein DAERI_060137 [Deinococcus aerius]|uniref:Uncharacterized protein n=1 Tax=Deinococcus aerius TaxID=200253 RepID=A0A2I9DTD7_9DEIO|nr:hypothetical protein [Deinococcus aerius]GBF05877.1 hypothetical protein DAERI_060137 [Deinococcus aerius]
MLARNLPQPPADRQLSGRSGDTTTPQGRACTLLLHPVRRWALRRALEQGRVTPLEVAREYPYLGVSGASTNVLRSLLTSGVLRLDPHRGGTRTAHTYLPGDLSDLRALHAELSELLALAPAPEVQE